LEERKVLDVLILPSHQFFVGVIESEFEGVDRDNSVEEEGGRCYG